MNAKITPRTTNVPQHRLSRLAQRALRVLERHAPNHAVLQVIEPAFRETAEAFIASHDTVLSDGPRKRAELDEGRAAIDSLNRSLRSWVAWLGRDIQGFDPSEYTLNSVTPDDVLADARRLVHTLQAHQQSAATPLNYGDKLLQELTAALENARKEWTEAQDAITHDQERRAEVRALAGQVQKNLVALRRTLRTLLGTSHRDYQKLRLARSSQLDEEDLEVLAGDGVVGDPVGAPIGDGEGEESAA